MPDTPFQYGVIDNRVAATDDDLRPIEWCSADSPAQRFLESQGYREVAYKRFHPADQPWVKMERGE